MSTRLTNMGNSLSPKEQKMLVLHFARRRRDFLKRYSSTCVNPSPPGGGGVPWKVLAVRPLRAKFVALSPYGYTLLASSDARAGPDGA